MDIASLLDSQQALNETNEAIESTWASCCGALRYGGTDDGILIRLAELGLAEQCDFRLKQEPTPRARTCVSFEFAGQSKTAAACAREIASLARPDLQVPRNHKNRFCPKISHFATETN
jgi:hypothetical protein